MTEKFLLDEARVRCVLVDAVIDKVAPEKPVKAS
jgi:hypothetical protein